jgi:hypothetical protein
LYHAWQDDAKDIFVGVLGPVRDDEPIPVSVCH